MFNRMNVRRGKMTEGCRVVTADVLKHELSTITDVQAEESEKILSTKTEEGWSPLHVAVITSNEEVVSHLISVGADPTDVDIDGRTPFHWSAFRDVSFRVFDSIARVSKNQGLTRRDRYGKTPLHYVCLNKRTELNGDRDIHETLHKLQFLLVHSENIELKDVEGNTPLLLLCKNIHNYGTSEDISHNEVRGILEVSQFRSRSACGFALEMFLKRGANIMTQNDYGVSPLHAACKVNCVEMIRTLILQLQELSELSTDKEKNAMEMIAHLTDACGNTPMMSVFKAQMCKSLKYAVHDSSPWSHVGDLKHRFQDSLRPILKHMRSSVNISKSTSGSTVLHYALDDAFSSFDVVKGLIGYGKADVNARNFMGETPLHHAILPDLSFNPVEFRELLIHNRERKVHLLLQNGAELNAEDLCGCSPLHNAVLAGDVELVELLLQNKADVNAINKYGDTPLNFTNLCEKDSEIVLSIKRLLRSAMDKRVPNQSKHSEDKPSDCSVEEELLQQSLDEAQAELSQYQIQHDTYLCPIHVNAAESWFNGNSSQWILTDQKMQELLDTSRSKSLSNDASQNMVLSQTMNLMEMVFQDVEKLDPRFKVNLELSGSTREGCKVNKPDEFDILCFLEHFQTICDIEEGESGYVQCKLSDGEDSRTFAEFFDGSKLLNGSKLTSALYCNIKKALGHSHVWTTAPGLTLGRENHEYKYEDGLSGILCLHLLYTDENYRYMQISVDVVPAIRKRNWWPTFGRQQGELVTPNTKKQGCMVIAKPRTEVTLFGERIKFLTQFKVSVYLSECSVLTSLPETIRDAYKLAKILFSQTALYPPLFDRQEEVNGGDGDIPDIPETGFHPTYSYLQSSFSSYMLKNALLYELDEESQQRRLSPERRDIKEPPSNVSLDERQTKDLPGCNVTRRWTVRMFRRLLKLSRSDEFFPYFLPTNSLFLKRGPNTLTEIQETVYKMIIAILEGKYGN